MNIKLVAFDVDGVLAQVYSIWRHIHEQLGTLEKCRKYAEAYYSGKISYDEWARLDASTWKGKPISLLKEIANRIPITPGAHKTISELKHLGLKTVAISAGLDILTDRISAELGLDYAVSNILVHRNGVVTGDVIVKVRAYDKDRVLAQICRRYGITTRECAVVGDSPVDIPMFRVAGLAIAFNPSAHQISKAAHLTIYSKQLTSIIPPIKHIINKE